MDTELPVASDSELAEAVALGEPAADARLYERFGSRVHHLAQRELRARDLADDARNETFLRVITALRQGRLRIPGSLASFVLQTTRYVIYETLRHERRPRHEPLDERLVASLKAPSAEVFDVAVADAVRQTIDGLSSRDRAFLRMYYYEELPTADIARRLGIDAERVRLIKSRALARFRDAYAARVRGL